jgi:hypothetical protein
MATPRRSLGSGHRWPHHEVVRYPEWQETIDGV